MTWYTYDCEVFAHDFIVDFKNKATGEHTTFHNNNLGVKEFITQDGIYCGFNTKGYDQYIVKAICGGLTPEEVKQVNDWIIGSGRGWECPLLNGIYYSFNNVDIIDDVQKGLSLKAIEGHLGLGIEETEVDFNLDRPLTDEELALTVKYCRHDVDAAEKLTDIRMDYLKTKLNLGKRAGIDEVKALSATNAKLTAFMLKAVRREWTDGRDYVYPKNLILSDIPQPVLDFFETIHDMSIPDDVLFETYFEMELGGMPCKWAWGGVHGSLKGCYEESTEDRVIQNRDVSSLYPSLIEIYNYLSRNVPDPQLFFDIRKERIAAKHSGDKQTANDLKLPLNTVSGAQENQYNDLYDPLPTRSMRISGQLFLTMLAVRLLRECKTIKLLNLNTDGLAYSIDRHELPIVDRICAEWERQTKFELETDDISKMWIKDVNNLLIIMTNGKVKTVGSYLNYGISAKGAWAINNNMIIVKKALVEYFAHGTPVEETIGNCDNLFEFQIIAKAGAKYREAYHLVDGVAIPIQKVNRVYSTTDTRYGKIYKVKAENDAAAKIEMLPEHCIIDNDNQLTIDQIDRTFYIETACKRINDFLGIKPEKNKRRKPKMAANSETPKTNKTAREGKASNVYQRLTLVREEFHAKGVKKSGRNMKLTSKYFDLEDIIPNSRPLFKKHELIPICNFTKDEGIMTIVDMLNPESTIVFTTPRREWEGNKSVNPVQASGATDTYMRRYLYQQALDIVEEDEIEGGLNGSIPAPAPVNTDTAPVTTTTPTGGAKPIHFAPTDNTKPMTAASGNASETQIKQLKEVLKKLIEKDPVKENIAAKIAIQTKAFTEVSKADCEALTIELGKMLNEEAE